MKTRKTIPNEAAASLALPMDSLYPEAPVRVEAEVVKLCVPSTCSTCGRGCCNCRDCVAYHHGRYNTCDACYRASVQSLAKPSGVMMGAQGGQ